MLFFCSIREIFDNGGAESYSRGRRIFKRTYDLEQNFIEEKTLRDDDSIAIDTVKFHKDAIVSCIDARQLEFTKTMVKAEKKMLDEVQSMDQQIRELVDMKNAFEDESILSRYQPSEGPKESAEDMTLTSIIDGEAKRSKKDLHDYLTPLLRLASDPENITKQEAIKICDACLRNCKERLTERANKMRCRLKEEKENLLKKHEHNSDGDQCQSQNLEETSIAALQQQEKVRGEISFRISILERRIQLHEETVSERYKVSESQVS